MRDPAAPVSCKHGAPMGRPSRNQDCVGRVTLRKIPLDSGGYDAGGAYWGIGSPLYWACDESGALDRYFRAANREAAKAIILADWPEAKFYR